MDRAQGKYKDDTLAIYEDLYKQCTFIPNKYGDIANIEYTKQMLGRNLLVSDDMRRFFDVRRELRRKIIELHAAKGTK